MNRDSGPFGGRESILPFFLNNGLKKDLSKIYQEDFAEEILEIMIWQENFMKIMKFS